MIPSPIFETVSIPTIQPLTDAITFDEKDAGLLGTAIRFRAISFKPLVGDYCIRQSGEVCRLAYETKDRFNVTHKVMKGSFHLHDLGTMSYSGAFPETVRKADLVARGDLRSATCWMFHHGISGAGRGVDVIMPCRVFVEVRS
jgi:hypothetical protein